MSNAFVNIFGKSPVMPIEKHMGLVCDAASTLQGLLVAASKGDWNAVAEAREKILDLWGQASQRNREIRLNLPKSLFMPVSRGDILGLLHAQHKILSATKDLADIVMLRKLTLPGALGDDYLAFADRAIDAVRQAGKSVRELDELFTSGFRGAEAELVEEMVEELDEIETDVDVRRFELQRRLVDAESTIDAVDVIFLHRLVVNTADLAARASRVGERLELLLSH